MKRPQRLQERNIAVRKLFNDLSKKYPQWRTEQIIKMIADKVYLSEKTTEAIIKERGAYKT